jgi:hypothetical protein
MLFQPYCLPPGMATPDATYQIVSATGIVGSRRRHLPAAEQPSIFYNHMPAREVKLSLGSLIDSYFKFCTMRNPFDKVVSHFWWDYRDFDFADEPFPKIKERFTEYVRRQFGTFNDRYIFMIDGRSIIDQFIRYEHLMIDLAAVSRRLDIVFEPRQLGNDKSGFRKRSEHFSTYYNPITKRLIETEFAWELGHFNYSL